MRRTSSKTCEFCKKKILGDEIAARNHIGDLLRKQVPFEKPGGFALVPYECAYGNGWHVGRNHETIMINFKKGRTKNVGTVNHQVQNGQRISL